MFEGIYFQFPKLGFLLFFFLACEALCPLRSNSLYFPRVGMFDAVGVKSPLWLWIAKWAMITFLIIAIMSPVRDKQIEHEGNGYDVLLVLDPSLIDPNTVAKIGSFIDLHPHERFGLWIPDDVIVPLTYEHEALKSILHQVPRSEGKKTQISELSRFFATSSEGKKGVLLFSNRQESFIGVLPEEMKITLISPLKEKEWDRHLSSLFPAYTLQPLHRYFEFYYVYPLFLGFLAMLAYLYGRNQKGLK